MGHGLQLRVALAFNVLLSKLASWTIKLTGVLAFLSFHLIACHNTKEFEVQTKVVDQALLAISNNDSVELFSLIRSNLEAIGTDREIIYSVTAEVWRDVERSKAINERHYKFIEYDPTSPLLVDVVVSFSEQKDRNDLTLVFTFDKSNQNQIYKIVVPPVIRHPHKRW